VDDARIRDQIESLVNEEKELLREGEGQGPEEERHERLEKVKVELDRCWDLLRQRQAREEFGQDPDQAEARDPKTVENYEQ
jgi:hypothetical protein